MLPLIVFKEYKSHSILYNTNVNFHQMEYLIKLSFDLYSIKKVGDLYLVCNR